jgi:hypothetical protein
MHAIKPPSEITSNDNIYLSFVLKVNTVLTKHACTTGARGTDHPLFSNFLFTNLFKEIFFFY